MSRKFEAGNVEEKRAVGDLGIDRNVLKRILK
jgi:hypothetical protein